MVGADALARDLARLPTRVDAALVRVIDDAVVSEMQRQRSQIPYYRGKPYRDKYGSHGGALMRSLTSSTDPFHRVDVTGDIVKVGTSIDYAKYQSDDIPQPDGRFVSARIAGEIFRRLQKR